MLSHIKAMHYDELHYFNTRCAALARSLTHAQLSAFVKTEAFATAADGHLHDTIMLDATVPLGRSSLARHEQSRKIVEAR